MLNHPLIQKTVTELRAYFNMEVDDDPYRIFQILENAKNEIPETYQRLAVQEYCLKLICGDLAEHGDAHLPYYGKGKMSEQQVIELHQSTIKALVEELKKTGAEQTEVWKAFGKVPRHIKEALNAK